MLFAFFMVCVVELGLATLLLLTLGDRIRFASRIVAFPLVAGLIYLAGWLAALAWNLAPGPVIGAEVFVFLVTSAVIVVRGVWNLVGQVFFASYVAAALAYLAFAAMVTVADGLSFIASVASALLFVLELSALSLSASFAFETCDVICRVRHSRHFPTADGAYQPFVSLQIPSYNEPPDMLIETIKAAEAIEYPNFEVVVIDNNTKDEATWRPVEDYCRDRPRVRFFHVDNLAGFKSGALNLALRSYTDPQAELVGVIDSDYLVDPSYLHDVVGYFADPNLAFLQTPQDYRDYEDSPYFRACYDAYRYFFSMAMPSRNERNSIIFAGTMGVLRRRVLEELGGWDEWVITEDADTSLRMLRAGYSGLFIARSYGRGVMPLTFASLKSQRYRWCFGGMQILRRHWRSLMPWDRSPDNHLTTAQRLDYLIGGVQWLNDLVYMGFTLVLLVVASLLIAGKHVPVRPFVGPTVLLPATLLATGLLRALWALRRRNRLSYRRAVLAFLNWLSLSFTVARACMEGLLRDEGTFLRTPKSGHVRRLGTALLAARAETIIALVMAGLACALLAIGTASPLVIALVFWQGSVYLASPAMSWLNQRAHLTPELERRRATEERRERLALVARRVGVGSLLASGAAGLIFMLVLAFGAANPGRPSNPLVVPEAHTQSQPGPGPAQGPNNSHNPSTTSTPSSSTTSSTSTTTSSSTSTTTSTSTTSTTTSTSTSIPTSTSTTTTPTG